MPDKDVSRLTVELAQGKMRRLRAHMQERMPYGPGKVKLTPAEFRKHWDAMPPESRLQMAQSMGYDEFLNQMSELYYGKRHAAHTQNTEAR